ncbi:DUF4097 family beta strand repeat-containing protein [Spirosoma radiotolerans]|uniref:Adhesin domain-containing protein n=1 Tax=Spirosoma radiotolerans TaxID=1379870 RepID=A0A0E3ZYT3_9BACT|nr:DUF4097 family beta strand repeat-containing protein [Spirosoma radiotolerans]AKD57635.1 hypothetical protein SD10_24810 [Spirosoma radiotolerans]
MKTHTLTTALLFLGLFLSRPLLAQNEVKEQLVVPLSDPGKPGTLHVGLINGSIHVIGYTGKDVVIDIVANPKRGRRDDNDDRPERSANGMKRIGTGSPLDVSAEERNNTVNINANTTRQTVDLTIKVPQRFSLKVSTVNNGTIEIENVSGNLEATNVNGYIHLANIAGSAVANTVNGNLIATFKAIDSDTPMAFSTLNGNVDVTFPASVKANSKLKSDRGDIYSDFDIDVDKNQPKVSRTSQSGMYQVKIEDWVYGKINGGGPEVMMKNMNGNIYIRKAK